MGIATTRDCELLVIGRGMAGMASALFAANRGISTVLVGPAGGIIFASGLLDLLGVHPVEENKVRSDPWAALRSLRNDRPGHPYSSLKDGWIDEAFQEVLSSLETVGLPYVRRKDQNCSMLTPLGTLKPTYAVPLSMWPGVEALEKKCPCLIVGFDGLSEFSAAQIAALLKEDWPRLRGVEVPFPSAAPGVELVTGEFLAGSLEASENRRRLIDSLAMHMRGAQAVGMPAILGMKGWLEVISELEAGLGARVFEIPTFPVSVPGLRLEEAFSRYLTLNGVTQFPQDRVLGVSPSGAGDFLVKVGGPVAETTVRAGGILLATGRFWGRGLFAERGRIRESLFGLPVHQPETRSQWHRVGFLEPRGHPVNSAGLEVDACFRPLSLSGKPAFENLFAAGSILAHQDWIRMKCGSGLAIATAYAAVKSFLEFH